MAMAEPNVHDDLDEYADSCGTCGWTPCECWRGDPVTTGEVLL